MRENYLAELEKFRETITAGILDRIIETFETFLEFGIDLTAMLINRPKVFEPRIVRKDDYQNKSVYNLAS